MLLLLAALSAFGGELCDSLGRTEARVTSAAFVPPVGRTVTELALPDRLERLGYERVHGRRPERPGEYFWGHDVFWVHRRAHRHDGRTEPDALLGWSLGPGGIVVGYVDPGGELIEPWGLEPEVIAEATEGRRAASIPVELDELPEHVWRPLLALEDHRFFDHVGLDGRAIARAALENVKAGGVRQGGSTITQQLVKMRDLSPKRTLDRKASEAIRALALEAEHDKEEILEAYLNTVYYGHVDGVGVYGLGTAARVFFSKDARDLDLSEAALLSAIVQGPNGLSPVDHPDRAKARRDRALDRMVELGWATAAEVSAAKRPIRLDLDPPEAYGARWFRDHVVATLEDRRPGRMERGLGFSAETTLDPWLQDKVEEEVAGWLAELRQPEVTAAAVVLDGQDGSVLAWVGGDPRHPDGFDRVQARRQPGSTVKPLVLLEAFDRCGSRRPLTPATLVSDAPIELNQVDGTWEPANYDHANHGDVPIRDALVNSYNLPFVRVSLYCGLSDVAGRLDRAGLDVPEPAPQSLALGAVEATPLEVAGAFTVFSDLGIFHEPWWLTRVERPGGGRITAQRDRRTRVTSSATAWLVRDLLRDAVDHGTGTRAHVPDAVVAGKTGTTPRDAWFAGIADGVVIAVWLGRDDGGALGLTGGGAAAPLFARIAAHAAPLRPIVDPEAPAMIVTRRIDPDTGRLVATPLARGEEELFRRGAVPRREPIFGDRPTPVIR